jgi:hypothetical protein
VVGEEWIAVVNDEPGDNSLYQIRPDLASPEIRQLTATQVFAGTGCPVSTTRDGAVILFVDSAHYIRAIASDGSLERVISSTGEWWSLAISHDGTKLAATSIYIDSNIYIFDFANPDSSKAIHLYNPTTDGDNLYVTLFADALDWDQSGQYVLYDAFNRVQKATGGSIDYWNVDVLDVENGIILPLFPPLSKGVQIGNPAFASNNDAFIVFDLIDENTSTDHIFAANLFTQDLNHIEANGSSPGYPDYSPNDDCIVFQRYEAGHNTLRQIAVDNTKIVPIDSSLAWIVDGMLPTWFVVESPVDVNDRDPLESLPTTFTLAQNYPNPFNATTTISYWLARGGRVEISVLNVLGETVKTILDEYQGAGSHSIVWDGTDAAGAEVATGIYLYRIQLGDCHTTKKMLLLK